MDQIMEFLNSENGLLIVILLVILFTQNTEGGMLQGLLDKLLNRQPKPAPVPTPVPVAVLDEVRVEPIDKDRPVLDLLQKILPMLLPLLLPLLLAQVKDELKKDGVIK
jgi:hypothetical protein